MRKSHIVYCAAITACFAMGSGCSRKEASQTIDPSRLQVFAALPEAVQPVMGELTEEKIALGRMLYYEPRLSLEQETFLQLVP